MSEESGKRLTFDVVVFDAGVPQKSASALVVANIINLNDEAPKFDKVMEKEISLTLAHANIAK